MSEQEITPGHVWVVRIAGWSGLLLIALTLAVNFALTPQTPAAGASSEEFAAFFSANSTSMAWANGLRNLGLFLLPVWAVGLYSLIGRSTDYVARAWATTGIVASAALLALGTVNNLIQTASFVDLPVYSEHPELRRLLWSLSGVGFGGASRLILGAFAASFSIAGWQSGTLPRWLCVVGLISAGACLLTVVAIAALLAGRWPDYVDLAVVMPTILVFWVGVSIQMLRRAEG